MKLPPLKALPVFEAVARSGSFSKAASELNVSQSAVSHQIRLLEDYLGESLFDRKGRRIGLTREGVGYFESVSAALAQIERASEQLLGNTDTRVRLALFSSFAVRWLVPRLPDLQRCHPQLDLALEMVNESPQLSDRLADCFITLHTENAGFSYDRLYVERLFPVCSRQYWNRFSAELGIDSASMSGQLEPALLGSATLLSTFSIFDAASRDWELWFESCGLLLSAGVRIQQFSHMLLALEAARYHQGVALTNDYMLDELNSNDELIKLPCPSVATGDTFHFACKTSRRRESAISILRHWLLDQARQSGLSPSDHRPAL